MLSSFKKVSFLRQAMQLIFLEVSLNLGHLIADQAANILCFFFREKDPVQMQVLIPVLHSRVPSAPQGLCAGAGTLPPARLSTQPAWGGPLQDSPGHPAADPAAQPAADMGHGALGAVLCAAAGAGPSSQQQNAQSLQPDSLGDVPA